MIKFDPILVHDWLSRSARLFPNKEALICGKKRLTYSTLEQFTNRLARVLITLGVKFQDRIIVLLDNSAEAVISLYGILKAGCAFVILEGTTIGAKLSHVLENSEASFLITHTSKAKVVNDAFNVKKKDCKIIWVGPKKKIHRKLLPFSISWEEIDLQPDRLVHFEQKLGGDFLPCLDIDLASLIYTSGSTGEPKGVMVTHHNMISAARSVIQYIGNIEEDVILNVLPLSFSYGLYQIIMTFMFGGTVCLEKSFLYVHKVLEHIEREKVTGFPVVPTIVAMLLNLQDLKKYDFSTLRYMTNAGAALPIKHIQKLRTLLPHVKIFSMYGLTECKRVAYLPPEDIDKTPLSVGKPIPNCQAFIVDEFGNQVPTGESGELVVRGSNVAQGYWKDLKLSKKVFRQGRYFSERILYTGDCFRWDKKGNLYFLYKKNDMIKSKDRRISAREIESVICNMRGVKEVAVIGVPDQILGQAIKAFIVLKPKFKLTKSEIKRYCAKNIENFMIPKHIMFIDDLPKTSRGKINKKKLKMKEF